MKPFDNVAISSTEPKNKADIWIKHCKNMFKTLPNTQTVNGITFTNNGDGTIIANGTATAVAYITIDKRNLQSNKYALSGCPVGGGQDKYSIYMTDTSTWGNIAQDFGNGANFNLDSLKNIEIRLRVAAGVTVNNLVFKPQLEIGEQTKFTPYFEDDIFVNDNGVYKSVLTKEIKTGIEIKTNNVLDGKDVYYKRVDLENLPNNTTKEVDTGLSDVNILKIDGIAKESSGTVIPLPFVIADTTKSVAIVFNTTTNKITITTGTDRTNFSGYANLYYTKN